MTISDKGKEIHKEIYKEIHFNEYGMIRIPEEITEAQEEYWEVVAPYLEKMSSVEVRAFENYTSLAGLFATYLLRRAFNKRNKNKKDEAYEKE